MQTVVPPGLAPLGGIGGTGCVAQGTGFVPSGRHCGGTPVSCSDLYCAGGTIWRLSVTSFLKFINNNLCKQQEIELDGVNRSQIKCDTLSQSIPELDNEK